VLLLSFGLMTNTITKGNTNKTTKKHSTESERIEKSISSEFWFSFNTITYDVRTRAVLREQVSDRQPGLDRGAIDFHLRCSKSFQPIRVMLVSESRWELRKKTS